MARSKSRAHYNGPSSHYPYARLPANTPPSVTPPHRKMRVKRTLVSYDRLPEETSKRGRERKMKVRKWLEGGKVGGSGRGGDRNSEGEVSGGHEMVVLGGGDVEEDEEKTEVVEEEEEEEEQEKGGPPEVELVDDMETDIDTDDHPVEDSTDIENLDPSSLCSSSSPAPVRKRMRLSDSIYDSPSKLHQAGRRMPFTSHCYQHNKACLSQPLSLTPPGPHKPFPPLSSTPLHRALATLKYDTNPPDRPSWVTGIHKPLPHPSLTINQYNQILTTMYFKEIERLEPIRKQLLKRNNPGHRYNYGHSDEDGEGDEDEAGREAGEWHYNSFGSTQEVEKLWTKGTVLARGVWKFVDAEGEVRDVVLDEWPRDVYGEKLGWGVLRGVRREVGSKNRDSGSGSGSDGNEIEEDGKDEEDAEGMKQKTRGKIWAWDVDGGGDETECKEGERTGEDEGDEADDEDDDAEGEGED
ncbi:uncharacterized protein BDR25DRAFT_71482 [Lindgomyces ingoldianus]|uniref:Uncharacterized protein n=1 Tax=Lindgomyces ingoldianus TaxID=673940 RepID=A0ACB6QIS8_9PLEO|nr:uncharacterized protein BDR25DRAFT_71482 [Lindgomyces ingoldianus]KAF2466909.1 hypothetical protein BDR25DRAFT_71482 [Lindgomyces ingoldianus]